MMLLWVLFFGLLATSISLGARIPDNGLGHASGTTNRLNEDTLPLSPPKKATFILECDIPIYAQIEGLCWIDERTFLLLDKAHEQVLQFDLDLTLKICMKSVLYSNVSGIRLACRPTGEIYIADYGNKVIRIINSGNRTDWRPEVLPDTTWGGLAVNDDFIALDFWHRPANLYNRRGKFIRQVRSEAERFGYKFALQLSPSSDYMAASAAFDNSVIIHNLKKNESVIVGASRLYEPMSVTFDPSEKYILVCSYGSQMIGVFGVDGSFVHALELGAGGSNTEISLFHATIHRQGKSTLLAVMMNTYQSINIYSLSV